jgi:hypothetical protein
VWLWDVSICLMFGDGWETENIVTENVGVAILNNSNEENEGQYV